MSESEELRELRVYCASLKMEVSEMRIENRAFQEALMKIWDLPRDVVDGMCGAWGVEYNDNDFDWVRCPLPAGHTDAHDGSPRGSTVSRWITYHQPWRIAQDALGAQFSAHRVPKP